MPSLLNGFLTYTKDAPSPERFRLWSAIHAIGAAGERRIWTRLGINKLHPNLFVFLVSPPGIGKSQAINPMSVILRKSQAALLAPTDMTKQGLLDALEQCGRGAIVNGEPFDYHFMAICISELSDFMPQYDPALAGLLTNLFDCPPISEEQKRGQGKKSKVIPFPGISFIMGTATKNLGNTITDELWGTGFMARVIMVYSDEEVIPKDMFAQPEVDKDLEEELATALRRIGQLKGEMAWEIPAQIALRDFRISQKEGAPIHNRLESYVVRRWLHLAKLTMVAAMADERMVVTLDDFALAKSWLLEVESFMPEIFKDMISHEDGQIYAELQSYVFQRQQIVRGPIHREEIIRFIAGRSATHSVLRIIEVAEASGRIQRVAGTSGDDAQYLAGKNFGPTPGVL